MIHTRPFDASRSFTGHSRTDAKKQNDAGFAGLANGYQAKSSIGLGCENSSGRLKGIEVALVIADCGLAVVCT